MHITQVLAATLSLACLASSANVAARSSGTDLVVRQEGPAPAGPNGERTVQIVTVGDNNGSLKFFPENIKADVGSVVQFQFYPKNHTITESSFAEPCVPMASNLTTAQRPGQKSGFVPVTTDTQFRPVYNLIVNDTKPIWIFCGQMPHCQRGMAMVINVNETSPDKTLEKYKEAAAQIPVPSSAGAAPAGSASASASAVSSAVASASTVVPPGASNTAAGPSLAGTVTSAAAQSASATGGIATFTGAAPPARELPVVGLVAAGAAWALL